jgi:hypothetical protein
MFFYVKANKNKPNHDISYIKASKINILSNNILEFFINEKQ